MSGDLSMFVTSVTSSGAHIKFYAQLNTDKYAALDAIITANQKQFDMSTLGSPYELKPGEQVLVKSMSGESAKWHRARVNNIQSIEFGTVAIQFIDYGTNEVVHYSQICTSCNAVAATVLSQPPLATECVLADVVPSMGIWADAAISFAESNLLFQMVIGHVVRQDGQDGPLHVRVFTADRRSLASELVARGLGRPAETGAVPPGYQSAAGAGLMGPPCPPPNQPPPPAEFALRVKEMTTAPAQPGSEGLVTICHYSNGPAKFAIQNHHQKATLAQLMTDIQAYCRTSPAVPLSLLEPGAVCLGASASRNGQYLRGVITQVDGGLVKVYWADFGHDETKAVVEMRAMPRQFAGPWIQASRVSLAGLDGLTPTAAAPHVFRQLTDGKLLTCKFRGQDQPNQVDLYDMGQSILEQLLQRGAYTAPGGAPPPAAAGGGGGGARPSGPSGAVRAPRYPAAAAVAAGGPPLSVGSTTQVLVVAVSAVNNLYVRVAQTEPLLQETLQQLSESLAAAGGGQPLTSADLRVGTLCAIFKDGAYQRARVVSLGRRDIKVQYIDMGTSELVPIQSVVRLEQRFAALPAQAIHCCLEGLEGTHGSADHVRYLQSVTAGGALLATVLHVQGERRVVRLTDERRRPPLDVAAAVREVIAAAAAAHELAPPAGQLIRAPAAVSVIVSRPQVTLGQPEQLVVMHVESAGCWFGQLTRLDADAMYAMEEAMQQQYGGGRLRPLDSAPIGAFCAAKSTLNDTFYRAKVVGRQDSRVTVQFIDYGDKEEKPVSEVFPLSAEFTTLPQLGIFCSLLGGGAIRAEQFRSLMQDQTVDVLPRACQTELYEVTLPASQLNRPLLARLTSAGLQEPPAAGAPAPSRPAEPLPQHRLPVGVYKEVEVVHVVSPAEFYLQLKEQFAAVDATQEQLAAYGSAAPPPAPPAPGQTVAALYPDDGLWYRARVLDSAQGRVTVFFVDYGDTRPVPADEVRLLRPEHRTLAGQAIRCCSSDASRSGRTTWPEKETEEFRSTVMEVPYLARCEEQRGDTAVVTLARAELLEPVLTQPPPATRQDSGGHVKKPPPPQSRADLDRNWRERPPASASDPFSGRMRMDQPEAYTRPQRGGGPRDGRAGGDSRPGAERGWDGHDNRASQERGVPDGAGARGPERLGSGRTRAPDRAAAPNSDWSSGGGGGSGGRAAAGQTRAPDRGPGGDSAWSGGGRAPRGDAGAPRQPPAPAVSIPEHSARLKPTALPAGAELRGTPTWVCGLHEFYVQPLDGGDQFNRLMTEMQTFYGGLRKQDGAETSPAVSKPVAARFTDGAWYRAVVLKCSHTELLVHFVDYGNSAAVERQLVKRLKEEYCRLPCHAYRCQFAGVAPVGGKWKVLSEKELAKYFEAEIQVTCLSSEGSLSSVEVALSSSGQRATDQLVASGLAERLTAGRSVQQTNIGPFPALERPFSAGERLGVFVACVLSPSRLYVQLSENTEEIEQMAADIEKSTADCRVPCADVAADEICLAPFEAVYYRGLITAVSGEQATVYFVDYGNTEQVAVAELVECPVPLVDLPAQAIHCSMTGVSADVGEQLTALVDQMELTALVDRVMPTCLSVTLLDGGTNINLKLGGDGKVRSPSPLAKGVAATTATTTSAAPAAAAGAAPAPAPAPAASSPSASPGTAAQSAAAAPFSKATVSFAVSPHEFYVQDASEEPAALLDSLMAQLESEYGQLAAEDRAVVQVQPGDLVAAPFADDGVFYRARLLTFDPETDLCQVQFIDYGNCQSTARSALKRLTPDLLAPARLARRCRLPERPAAAAGQWAAGDTETFEQLAGTLEKVLTLRQVGGEERQGEDVWTVRLLDGERDVGAELVKAGHALPPAADAPAVVTDAPAAATDAPAAAAASGPVQPTGPVGMARLKEARLLDAAVVFSLSPTDFWVQLSADTATLDALMAQLESAPLVSAAAPAVGQLLVARYAEDGALYRARVLAAAADTVTVLFVDYGNTESVAAAEVWACPAELSAVPPLAVHCSLPLEPQPWSDTAVEKFSTLVGVGGAEERTLNLELVRPSDPALVNLFDGQEDVAFAMVGAGFGMVHVEERPLLSSVAATATETEAKAEAEATEPTATVATGDQTAKEGREKEPDDQTTEPELASEQAVFVSHVTSPLEFYVQPADTAPLDALMEKLAAAFPAAGQLAAAEPGLLAAAPFSEDGVPYRARVLSAADGQARVLFVDYGNSEAVSVSELRELDGALATLPPQARPCQLAVDRCEEGAAERLRELTEAEEGPVAVRQLAAGAVSRVRLTLTGGDAAELLVAAGLCQPRAELQLPAAAPPPAVSPLRLLVSHIDSPGCFFVQRLSELVALDEMADQLAELYDGAERPPVLAAPCCGDLCVARSAEEEGWHRARVETASPAGEVRVRLLDYGSVAAASEVRAAAPAVCQTPAMALRCRLPARLADPAAGWGQEAAAALAEISAAADHKFDARLVADGGEAVVALLSLNGESVTQLLRERGVELVEDMPEESEEDPPAEIAKESLAETVEDPVNEAVSEAAVTEKSAEVEDGEEKVAEHEERESVSDSDEKMQEKESTAAGVSERSEEVTEEKHEKLSDASDQEMDDSSDKSDARQVEEAGRASDKTADDVKHSAGDETGQGAECSVNGVSSPQSGDEVAEASRDAGATSQESSDAEAEKYEDAKAEESDPGDATSAAPSATAAPTEVSAAAGSGSPAPSDLKSSAAAVTDQTA